MQSSRWCFTINNPTEDDELRITELLAAIPDDRIDYLVVGREIGDSGTPHLQGFVIFTSRKRLAAVKEVIGDRCHLEPARGTSCQAADYCRKDGDYREAGNAPRTRLKKDPTEAFVAWVKEFDAANHRSPSEREIAQAHPGLYLRHGTRLVALATHLLPNVGLVNEPTFEWQQELENRLLTEADDRTIEFYVDEDGGKGKSWFCRHMLTQYPELTSVFSTGKRDDIAYAIDITKRIILFNVPRGDMQYFQYGLAEGLKDRVIFSPKYNSTTKIMLYRVHVVIFTNEMPDMNRLTRDRYRITQL